MCLHTHPKKKGKIELEIEINSFLTSIIVREKFLADAKSAVQALFDSCKNPNCHYFQSRLAAIELAFGY